MSGALQMGVRWWCAGPAPPPAPRPAASCWCRCRRTKARAPPRPRARSARWPCRKRRNCEAVAMAQSWRDPLLRRAGPPNSLVPRSSPTALHGAWRQALRAPRGSACPRSGATAWQRAPWARPRRCWRARGCRWCSTSMRRCWPRSRWGSWRRAWRPRALRTARRSRPPRPPAPPSGAPAPGCFDLADRVWALAQMLGCCL